MTRIGRALLGATLGAALTLLLHPTSRPYLFSAFLSPSTTTVVRKTGIPDNLVELSDWMTEAGDRFVAHKPLSRVEIENAIAGAMKGSQMDPDNAFWKQMLASLYHLLGDESAALRHWMKASACANWNDYQSVKLLAERERFGKNFGARQSWQLAYVYYQRSESTGHLISAYARSLLPKAPLKTNAGLLIRATNVLNGDLLREGSRSVRVAEYGSEMAEMACHAVEDSPKPSRHKLYISRSNLHSDLARIGEPGLADKVNHIYRETDAWDVYLSPEMASEEAQLNTLLSLVYVSLPSMLLVVGLVGVLLALVGLSLKRVVRIHLIPATVVGTVLALGAYFITFLPLVSLATFLCCMFLTLGPKRERKVAVNDLGPMFSFTVGALGIVFLILLGSFIVGASVPAVSLLPILNVPHEYFGGSGVLLGLSIIVLAILLLLAPLFAIALRVGTSFVLFTALRKFGSFLAYTSLATLVIGTPMCIYFDRDNSATLERVVSNEPMHYLSR